MSLCPIAPDELTPAAKKATDAAAPARAKMMVARGLAPMPPRDLVTAQFVLTFDADETIAQVASEALANLDERMSRAVLDDTQLHGEVLAYLASALISRDGDLERILLNPSTPHGALETMAGSASEQICELIARNQQRILQRPTIVEGLSQNPKALRSTVDRVIDFLIRNGIVLDTVPEFEQALLRLNGEERIQAAEAVEIPQQLLDKAVADLGVEEEEPDADESADPEKTQTIEELIASLTTGQKVALAIKGNKAARTRLLRDTNRVVVLAVISSPTISEGEVLTAAQSRTIHVDVISFISRNKEWMRNYPMKLALAQNPKTPLPTAMRLVPLLNRRDCKALSTSKNVAQGVRTLARRLSQPR